MLELKDAAEEDEDEEPPPEGMSAAASSVRPRSEIMVQGVQSAQMRVLSCQHSSLGRTCSR